MTPGQVAEFLLARGLQASLFVAKNKRTYVKSSAANIPFLIDFGKIEQDRIGKFPFVSFHVSFEENSWKLEQINEWSAANRWLRLWQDNGNLFAELDILLNQDTLTEDLLIQHMLLWEMGLERLLADLPGYT